MSKINVSDSTEELDRLLEEKQRKAEEEAQKAEEEALAEVEAETAEQHLDPFTEDVMNLLKEEGVHPDEIDEAKARYGKIWCYPWSTTKVYLFRALKRKEWNKIKAVAEDEAQFQHLLIRQGLIFPNLSSVEHFDEELAGIQDTLVELIMRASGFIPFEQAFATLREL